MLWPKVTINLVITQHDEMVMPALEALLQQTYPYFRILILVSNACAEEAGEFERLDSSHQVSIHQTPVRDAEEQHAWAACSLIEDEYVLFTYPEYPLLPTCLEKLMRPVQRHEGPANLVYGNAALTREADGRSEGYEPFAFSSKAEIGSILVLGSAFDRSFPLLCHIPSIKAQGGFVAGFGAASTYELILRFAESELIVAHVPDVLVFPQPERELGRQRAEFAAAFLPHYLGLIEKYVDQPTAFRLFPFKNRLLKAARKAAYSLMSWEAQQAYIERVNARFQSLALIEQKNMEPTVSVIVVVDTMNALQHALDQMEGQTYQNWELVLLQMGHSSFEGLCQYRAIHDRIRPIHAPLTHESDCWLQAHRLVKGSCITYLDSNTQWDVQHLERMVKTLQQPGIAIAVSPTQFHLHDQAFTLSLVVPRAEQYTVHQEIMFSWIERSSVMIRTCHIDQGLWNLSSHVADADWSFRLKQLLNFLSVNTLAIGYATHPTVRIESDARRYFECWSLLRRQRLQKVHSLDTALPIEDYHYESLLAVALEIGDIAAMVA